MPKPNPTRPGVLASAFLALLLVVAPGTALAQRPGDPAPDFALLDDEGRVVRLSDFRGTPVVLNAWATWCPFCIDEIPLFQSVHETLEQTAAAGAEGSEVVFLLVNLDEAFDPASRFLREEVGTSLTALYDGTPDQRAAAGTELAETRRLLTQSYRVRGMPTTFFIDAEGIVRTVKVGPVLSAADLAGLLAEIGVDFQPGSTARIEGSER